VTASPSSSDRWSPTYDPEPFFGRLRRRVVLSVGGGTAWVCATLLFLAFWARGFSLLQDIAVIVVSLLLVAGILLAAWISFGLKFLSSGC